MIRVSFPLFGIYKLLSKNYNAVRVLIRDISSSISRVGASTKKIIREIGKSKAEFSRQQVTWSILGFGTGLKDNKNDWSKEKQVAYHIAMAEIAIKDGNLKQAEFLLEEALLISNTTKTIGITCVYDMLATIAYRKGEVAKAEDLLVQVIQKLVYGGLAPNHNTVVNFSLKLARIYSNLGQDDLAEMGFRNCLAIQKKKYMSGEKDEETAMLWINTLFWYGKFLASKERFAEAKQCFDSAYTMCAHVKSVDTNQVMVMLYNLGEMTYAVGDSEGALRHLQNAVILGRSINCPDLATYYTKIGLVYLEKGALGEALRWCQDGSQSANRVKDKKVSAEAQDCVQRIKEAFQNQK